MKVQITLACFLAVVVYCSALKGRKIKPVMYHGGKIPPWLYGFPTVVDSVQSFQRPNCDTNGKKVDGFSCGDGQCIWKSMRCDGRQDCFNSFDEEEITCGFEPYICSEDEFDCGDGNCISASKRCNDRRDCANGDDEKNCDDMYLIRPNCDEKNGKPVNGVDCGDGECIFSNLLCDDVQDCFNQMDESPSTCPEIHENACTENEFQCGGTSKQCVPLTDRCDGNSDCSNNADEHDCPIKECPKDKIDCGDGVCYKRDQLCDGHQDCFNNTDEKHCTPKV